MVFVFSRLPYTPAPLSLSRLAEPLPLAEVEPAAPSEPEVSHRSETANFIWLAVHQILLRVGWIFKTESIVMPAFLDFIGGGPVLRGCMPVIQRVGFSLPPLLYARRLKLMPRKKWSVAMTSLAMAGPFALLSLMWFTGVWQSGANDGVPSANWWMPPLFLVIYAVFFCLTGMNQLGANSLQGKLVQAQRRGRLFMVAVVLGSPLAIAAAWWLLPGWLALPDGGFGWIFGIVAAMFVLAAISIMAADEEPDNFREQSTNPMQKLQAAWQAINSGRDARQISLLAGLVAVNFMLFPHYQAIGREQFGLGLGSMMTWVCIQNAATGVMSIIAGPLADRLGNRAALLFSTFGLTTAPLLVLVSLAVPRELATQWYWLVFAPIGFTPVTVRLLINYTLEISPTEDHPKFVSAIGMCLAIPVIVGSPLAGWLLGVIGSGPVFAGGFVCLLAAGVQTFRLSEPRHAKR